MSFPVQIVVFAPNQPLMGGGSCSHGAILEEHGSKGEAAAPEGKKAARQESANKASSAGRFGVPAAPGARSVN